MHAWQFTVDWLTWQMLPSCILHPRIEFRKWHKLRTASHSLSITNEFITFTSALCIHAANYDRRGEFGSDQLFPSPIPLPTPINFFFVVGKIGRAGTSWAAEERWRMGFSPLRRPRRRVQIEKMSVLIIDSLHTLSEMAAIALWSHGGLSQESMESSSRTIRQRHLAVRLLLPGYPPDLFVACQKSLILMFGKDPWHRHYYFYLHRDLPPFIILCANISFYNLAWDTNGLQISSAI